MNKTLYIALLLSTLVFSAIGQSDTERLDKIKVQMDLMLSDAPGLQEPIDLSVSNVPLKEFLRAIAASNKLNISVDPSVQGHVVNNFNNVSASQVLLFLAKEHNLDYEFTGNIIRVKPMAIKDSWETLVIEYDTLSESLILDLKNESLPKVTKALTNRTGRNIVFAPGLEAQKISVFLKNTSFDKAMDKMAFSNNLKISKTDDGFYLIELPENPKGKDEFRLNDLSSSGKSARFALNKNKISLEVRNQPLDDVVRNLFQNLGIEYFLYSKLDGTVTMSIREETLNMLMAKMLAGTQYTFRQRDSIYIIGDRKLEGLRETRRIYLQNRSVDKILEFIPKDISDGVEIKEFKELNSLLVSGSFPQILLIEEFIESIDKPVPVVIIEVIIVDYQKNHSVETGIQAGTGTNPNPGSGQLFPVFDYSFDANAINELIANFNGFGALNLGPVTPNFYLNLKFLEDNGVLNVKSTPKLSTLNGHEAKLSIGNKEYYVVEQTNVTGVQNPFPITTKNYQSVEANFSLTVKPIVSGGDQVTLDIQVEQSDFTARISPEAPPGSVTRQFTTMIRVKNGEVILLGGLEEKSTENTGRGVPLLSRIPILKWFFSSRTAKASNTKLNIFIKPTIIN